MEHYFTNNPNLKSEMRVISYENEGEVFTFFSDLGVFSKDKIDTGSNILVKTMLKHIKGNHLEILDVGCGYGFLAIVLGKKLNSKVTLVDVNKRAVHLSAKNCKENHVEGTCLVSDAYEAVEGKFDIIVTNPPIHVGKKVVYHILETAKDFLKKDGELWFVIRKDQGVKSTIKYLENTFRVEILEKEKGFYVVRAKIN